MSKSPFKFQKLYQDYTNWNRKNPIGKIPTEVAKEGAGENRIPFAHLANSVPVYLSFKQIINLKKRQFAKILDIGCGTGREISYIKDSLNFQNYKFFGIDYSSDCINFAKKQYQKFGVNFKKYNGKLLPFKNNTFNFVCSSHVLEHIPKKDGALYFKEILRVTAKGGIILIGTPNRKNCQDLFHLNPDDKPKYRLILPHEHEYYLSELVELLKINRKLFKKFQILETHNHFNRMLMEKSIDKIKPGQALTRKFLFFFYSKLRQIHLLQDLMARFGTEYILKTMNISYDQFASATTVKQSTNKAEGDNFIIIINK